MIAAVIIYLGLTAVAVAAVFGYLLWRLLKSATDEHDNVKEL
jgi:hypothetical protein